MASAKKNVVQAAASNTAVSTAATTVSIEQMARDAHKGMEGATADSFAIPFLGILQKGSPQVDEESGAQIEGAKAGMLFLNVNNRMFPGREGGVEIIHCAYRRVFLRWAPEGFRGEVLPEEVTRMMDAGELVTVDNRMYFPVDGKVDPKKCDRISEVRNHYILLLSPRDGVATQALMSLGSTQIKKSKMLMTALSNETIEAPDGSVFTPASFATVIKATTVPESNDKGTWYGWSFSLAGRSRPLDYAAALAFNKTVTAGKIVASYDEAQNPVETNDGKI